MDLAEIWPQFLPAFQTRVSLLSILVFLVHCLFYIFHFFSKPNSGPRPKPKKKQSKTIRSPVTMYR